MATVGSDEGLHLEITANASKATPAFEEIIAKAGLLRAGLGEATVAATQHEHAEEFMGVAAGRAATAINSAARAAGALGLGTAEASERVLALTESLELLKVSAIPLLGIGAAFIAIGASINLVKEGIANVASEQRTLQQIGSAVIEQGGAWAEAREEVEKYATTLSHATTFSRGEALDAIRSLTTAGVDLGDAEKIVAVATDVAAGSGKSLVDVTNEIKQAEVGRALSLAQLDPRLKAIIKSHGTLQAVLDELSRTYSGQAAAATDTFEGKQKILKDRLEDLSVELGTQLLPALSTGTDLLIAFAAEAEKQVPSWVAWGTSVVGTIQSVIDKINEINTVFKPVSDFLNTLAGSGEAIPPALGQNPANASDNPIIAAQRRAGTATVGGVNHGGGNGGGFGGDGGPTDIYSAISSSADRFAKESGLTADKLAAVITAIGQQETGLGTNTSNYNPRTGRDKDGNLGRGIFQLDPASGSSAAELDKVSTDVRAASDKATQMIVDGLKRNHGSLVAAIEAYGPHLKGGAPDPAYVTSVLKRMNDAGHGQTGIGGIDNLLMPMQIQRESESSAWAKQRAQLAHTALKNNPQIGGAPKGSGGSGAIDALPADVNEKVEGFVASQSRLEAVIKSAKDELLHYSEAVRLSTTTEGEKQAKAELAVQTQNRAAVAIRELTAQDRAENAERAKLNALLPEEITHRDTLLRSRNAYAASLGEAGAQTKAEREELKRLNKDHEEAVRAVNHTRASVQTLTSYLDRNAHAIQENRAHLQDLNAILATNARAEETAAAAAAKRQLDATVKDLAAEFGKTGIGGTNANRQKASDDRLALEHATYGVSIEEQRRYFESLYNDEVSANGRYSEEATRLYGELSKIQGETNKKRVDDAKAASDRIIGYESTFLDSFISKHKSMRDSLRDVWSSIVKDFESSLIKMIESKYLNAFASKISGFFGLGGGNAVGGSGGGLGSILGGLGGGGGGGGTGGFGKPDGTASNPITVQMHGSSIEKLTGSPAGVPLWAGVPVPGGTLDAAGSIAKSPSFLQNLGGNAAQGLALGQMASSLFGGNSGNAGIGGALGGILGTALHANPLIGAGIDIVSSLIGGLFGSHDKPEKMPDKYDTVNYGQGLADLTGRKAGANGQTFYTGTDVMAKTGGAGELSYIEKQLAGAKKDANGYYTMPNGATLTPGEYQQYISAFGSSASGSGKINFGKDIGQQFVSGAAGASTAFKSYKDLDQLASAFLGKGGTATLPAAAFTLSRAYPDANIASLIANGSYTPTATNGAMPSVTGVGGWRDVFSGGGTAPGNGSGIAPIHIVVNGNIVGTGGMHELAQIVSKATFDNDTGLGRSGYVAASGSRRLNGDG